MSKDLSKAYLNHRKSLKINEMEMCRMQFEEIVQEIMHKDKAFKHHELMRYEIEDIDRARLFWIQMYEYALIFLRENQGSNPIL
jgi:hypothetical protein